MTRTENPRTRFSSELKVDVRPSSIDALDKLAFESGTTRAHLVRTAIDRFVQAQGVARVAAVTPEEAERVEAFLLDIQNRVAEAAKAAA